MYALYVPRLCLPMILSKPHSPSGSETGYSKSSTRVVYLSLHAHAEHMCATHPLLLGVEALDLGERVVYFAHGALCPRLLVRLGILGEEP